LLNFFFIMMVCYLSLPVPAQASKPFSATLEGCVIKGVFFSVEKKVSTDSSAKISVYRMDVRNPKDLEKKLNLSPYEGKKIRLQGRLHPGDIFEANPKSLKVLGPCDRNSRNAISGSGR